MKVLYTSILLVFLTLNSAFADKLEKAFDALRIYNYFKAKELFTASLKKHPSAAAFGLATIYYRTDNPFHSIDSAYVYCNKAEETYSLASVKCKEKYKKLGYDYINVLELRASISSAFFQLAKKKNTCDGWNAFIDGHPWANEQFEAVFKRDSIAYSEVKAVNSAEQYQLFLENYPESNFVSDAQQALYVAQYREMTSSGKLAAYLEFMTKCPNNPFQLEAQDRVYEIATSTPSVEGVYAFISAYPKNRNVGKAWRYLYQLYMMDYSDGQIDRFIASYPNYPYKEELEKDLYLYRLKLLPFKSENGFGCMDYTGSIIIAAQYEQLGFFREGLASAMKLGKYGFIDKNNQVVIPFIYESVTDFENGRSVVEKDGKFGMIDRSGSAVFPIAFEDIGQLSEGLVYALKDSLYGYYDRNFNQRIAPAFEEAFAFAEGTAKVVVDGKQAFIDQYGSYLVPPVYESLQFFSDSLMIAEENGRFGLVNKSGQARTAFVYDQIASLTVNRALVVQNGLIGYIDASGKQVIPAKYNSFPNFSKRGQFVGAYALVSSNGKMGVIDQSGKTVVPFVFAGLGDVSALMSFTKTKQWGYIDLSAKIVIEPMYDFAESMKEGKALVEKNTLQGLIDPKGKIVLPLEYVAVNRLTKEFWIISNGSRMGLWHEKDGVVIPTVYQQIRSIDAQHVVLINPDSVDYLYLPEKRVIKVVQGE
jgi:hypothetical protein